MAERIWLYGAIFWIVLDLVFMALAVAALMGLLPGQ